jgi:hypothetical protein
MSDASAAQQRYLSDIVYAARLLVYQWEPSATDKRKVSSTGVGMRAAEDALILAVRLYDCVANDRVQTNIDNTTDTEGGT